MIKKIIKKGFLDDSPSKSVLSAAFVITISGLASRFLGLFRDRLLASTFGAGDTLDVYYAAFRIPDLIYNLLILGALSAAFVPVFTGLVSQEKEKEAWKLANGILNLAIFFLLGISLLFCLFASSFVPLITPGFSPEKIEKTIIFTRVMFLSPIFLGVSGIFGGILTSFKRFLIYSLAPLFYNVGIIIGVSILVGFLGPIGLAWGVALGAILHMLVQYPAVRSLGFRHSLKFRQCFFDRDVRRVFRLMIPRTLGVAVNQINLFVVTIFASTLAAGSLAIFNFAQNLQSVPLGIFGVSFSIAVFPNLSAHFAREEKEAFMKSFSETFRQILFFVIPISVFMLLLRAQLVRVILGAGKFDWEDTTLTFECLGIFVLSLFAQSLIPLLARSFYAMQDTKTPFYVALATETINIMAIFFLVGRFEILGLAYAFSISAVFQMLLLLFLLRSKFENLDDRNILVSILKIGAASFAAGLAVQLSKYLVGFFVGSEIDTFLEVFLQLFLGAAFGTTVFLAVSHFLKLKEYLQFKKSLTRRIFKEKKVIMEDTGEVSGI